LGDRVKEVRVSHRLTESPACLVVEANAIGMNLERLLKLAGQKVPPARPILEINPRHPLVQRLKKEPSGDRFADWAHLLLEQALLAEGGQLDDPGAFVRRLNQLMLALAGEESRIWVPGKG
jgi:molecular chaperone HtpG